jgi:hypothetical protein
MTEVGTTHGDGNSLALASFESHTLETFEFFRGTLYV